MKTPFVADVQPHVLHRDDVAFGGCWRCSCGWVYKDAWEAKGQPPHESHRDMLEEAIVQRYETTAPAPDNGSAA